MFFSRIPSRSGTQLLFLHIKKKARWAQRHRKLMKKTSRKVPRHGRSCGIQPEKIPQKNVDNGCKLTVCWEHLGFSLILISIYLEKQNQKHTTQIHNYNGKKKTKRMNHQVEIPKLTCQASEEEAEEEEKSPEEEEETLTR